MEDNMKRGSFSSLIWGFLIGGLIGAATALLVAPQSGIETRHMIGDRANDLKGRAADVASDTRDRAGKMISSARDQASGMVSKAVDQASGVINRTRDRMSDTVQQHNPMD